MKPCRFLPIKFFNLDGSIKIREEDLLKFFEDYSLSGFNLKEKVAKKSYEDILAKGFISQEYLDLIGGKLSDLNELAPRILGVYINPNLIYSGILRDGKILRLENSVDHVFNGGRPLISRETYDPSEITFLPPVNVLNHYVLWNNYNNPNLENPIFLSKSTSSIVGDGHPIMLKKEFIGQDLNPESELAVYFNKPLLQQSPEDLLKLIETKKLNLGLTIENDITWQNPAKKIPAEASRVKSQYSFAPIGPYLELDFDLNEVINREIILYLNGKKNKRGL